jgi:hypothetical protein
MLFWILLGLEIGIIVLASLSDYIWKERMNPSVHQRHEIGCRYCAQGNFSVEISGLWIHQFQDRWISCTADKQLRMGVTNAPLTGAMAWQVDELLPAIEQRG